jgi:hypothetical protein
MIVFLVFRLQVESDFKNYEETVNLWFYNRAVNNFLLILFC